MKPPSFTRRHLLAASTALGTTCLLRAAPSRVKKAAIIGHTGAGDYGHGIEKIFQGMPDVSVVAVADPVEAGRGKAMTSSGAATGYADYRDMLAKEKPDLVAIAPRWATEHHDMAIAALESGAHLYLEKPFTITLAEGDAILSLAKRKGLRVAVAHVTRMAPVVRRLEKALRDGLIGDLLEIHTIGKMGSRSGGQDMMVLGLHVFDLARLFAGDVEWCQASIRHQGRPAVLADAGESPSDKVGPVVGDDIFANFAMKSGIHVTFRSRVGLEKAAGPFGMEIIGSKGIVRLNSGFAPGISLLLNPDREATTRSENWQAWKGGVDPATETTFEGLTGYDASHRRVVRDWLDGIRDSREPLASGERALKAIEMAHGVFAAGIHGERLAFPLVKRTHPCMAS